MSSYFVPSAGFQFGSKRELLRTYNKKEDRPESHTINDFYDDKVSGELKAVRCNCGSYHFLNTTKKKTDWTSVLSRQEVKGLTLHRDSIKKTDQEATTTLW